MKSRLFLILFLLSFVACKPTNSRLLEQADFEESNQKGQLAKYLYLQVIRQASKPDETRFRALKGLARVSLNQLHNYDEAMHAIRTLIREFDSDKSRKEEVLEWKLQASSTLRLHLSRPDQALLILQTVEPGDISPKVLREFGKVYLDLREFVKAEEYFLRAWQHIGVQGDPECSLVEGLHLDIIQSFSLNKECENAVKWAQKELPSECAPDVFSTTVEQANCFERMDQTDAALALYEELVRQNPENNRARYLIEGIKQRRKRKMKK